MTEDEWKSAKDSTINAHYTALSVIDSMYKMLNRLGIKGGAILEPSMGVGNFFGDMPTALSLKSDLYGVEMDSITGRIAQKLYPDAKITIAPFQDVKYTEGSFDAAIGNVPFADISIPYNGSKYLLHDFFFVKSLDSVADNGIVMFITSSGTMDKGNETTRIDIAKKADLVAAFRLPSNAFMTVAGTSVTTDILIFQKRPQGIPQSKETFANIGLVNGKVQGNDTTYSEGKIPVNEYFVRHPENILGELVSERGMYKNNRTQCNPRQEDDLNILLERAVATLPKGIVNSDLSVRTVEIENEKSKSRFLEENGTIVAYDGSTGGIEEIKGLKADRARAFMNLRDVYDASLTTMTNDMSSDSDKEAVRKRLNDAYDVFFKKYGALSKYKTDLGKDDSYNRVSGLEKSGRRQEHSKKRYFHGKHHNSL